MSQIYSSWVGTVDPTEAFEYQLTARGTSYLIEIEGKFVKVLVPEIHAEVAPDPAAKKPPPKPQPTHTEALRSPSGSGR
jgi:hypothetical protein